MLHFGTSSCCWVSARMSGPWRQPRAASARGNATRGWCEARRGHPACHILAPALKDTWRHPKHLEAGAEWGPGSPLAPPPARYTSHILKTTLNYARACSGLWPGKSWSNQSGKMPHSDISLSCPQLLWARPWHRCRQKAGKVVATVKKRCWAALALLL